jgi:hypothetical protein
MELTEIEAFDFFFEALWKKVESSAPVETIKEKFKGNIVDTILFRHGKPIKWLFTSEKTGVLL